MKLIGPVQETTTRLVGAARIGKALRQATDIHHAALLRKALGHCPFCGEKPVACKRPTRSSRTLGLLQCGEACGACCEQGHAYDGRRDIRCELCGTFVPEPASPTLVALCGSCLQRELEARS